MHEHVQTLESELAAALHGMDSHAMQLPPSNRPLNWCGQQIVEHLLLSYGSTCKILETRLEKGSPTKAAPSFGQRLGQFYLIRLGHFPSGRKAPPAVTPGRPTTLLAGDALTQRIHESLCQLDAVAVRAQQLFGNQRCASHIVLGPLSPNDSRRFHLVHGRHQVKQIQQIRRDHSIYPDLASI